MKSLVKREAVKGIWMEDVPEPEVGMNDVLIRILRTAICGTDLHIYEWNEWAAKTIPVPMVIGHEFVGEVAEVGANVNDFHPGQIVSGEGHVVCGRCRNCMAGRRHLCAHTSGIGVNRPGAFAEYISLPMSNVWVHRPGIELDVASIFDPFGNAVHTALQFDLLGEDVLITGAARGIGFELARQYAEAGDRVFATTRNIDSAVPLRQLAEASNGNLSMHRMDVGDMDSVRACASDLDGAPIDVLINNAGVWGGLDTQTFQNMDYDNWAFELNVMTMGPFRVIQVFLDNVLAGEQRKIVTLSSQVAAHVYDHVIGYSYASAKAAVNRLMTALATELAEQKVIVVPMHPGWVKTEMAGDVADIEPHESAEGVREVIARMTLEDSGKFLKWTGDVHAW